MEGVTDIFFDEERNEMFDNFEVFSLSFIDKSLDRFENKLGINPPILIFISIINIKNYKIRYGERYFPSKYTADRDNLLVPDILIEDYNVEIDKIMLPAFEAIWNSFDFPTSPNYDPNSNHLLADWRKC